LSLLRRAPLPLRLPISPFLMPRFSLLRRASRAAFLRCYAADMAAADAAASALIIFALLRRCRYRH